MRFYLILLIFGSFPLSAQTVLLNGVVQDTDGMPLPSANILILPDSTIISTTADGKFSAKISAGYTQVIVSYIGYESSSLDATIRQDTSLVVSLKQSADLLAEITVQAERYTQEDILQSTRLGTNMLTQDDITAIPTLGGEADVIKTLQLLPGTIRGVEGSSDLFVRGGAADQNLVLLDGAPVYNTSHLFGFLSVFNPDVLERVEAINGGFPAEYGGRLSSILDIQSATGIPEKTRLSGDIGLIASRLFVEQPIMKNRVSAWVAGRRTYIDQVVKLVHEELPYFFYDLNGKVSIRPSDDDELDISYYGGEDVLSVFRDRNNDGIGSLTSYKSQNTTQSLIWRRQYPSAWKSHLALMRSAYQYSIHNAFNRNELSALSDITDVGAKLSFEKDSAGNGYFIKTGLEWTRHAISPNVVSSSGMIAELLRGNSTSGRIANEIAAHVQYERYITGRLRVNTGLRTSIGLVRHATYFFPEPRILARYSLRKNQALKLSYSRMVQYMHRISNSAVSTPTDIWYTVTDSIRPQKAHQVSGAWQCFLPAHKVYISAEGYYKIMHSLIGFEEGTNLLLNTDFESKLIQGEGKAYGLELLVRKEAGRLKGWISYTLSWSWRRFDEINGGERFPSRYDRRHNGALVAEYSLGRRWAVSGVWEIISGARFTPVIGQYPVLSPTLTGVDLVPIFSGINQVRLANTHRLDIGIKFTCKPESRFQWKWFAGVYNVYNRANPVGIMIVQDETDNSLHYQQPGLFGLLPFIGYGFKL